MTFTRCLIVFVAIVHHLSNANRLDLREIFGNVAYQNVYGLNVSSKCEDQLNIFSSSLQRGFGEDNIWAWKMIDATSKLQSGILEGNMGDLGAFDECIRILAYTSVGDINGKYCLGSLVFKKTTEANHLNKGMLVKHSGVDVGDVVDMFGNGQIGDLEKGSLLVKRSGVNVGDLLPELKWAACVPDACTADEISEVYSNLMDEHLDGVVNFKFTDAMCQTKEVVYPSLSNGAIITIIVFSIILVVIFLSTVYDLYVHYIKTKPAHIILIAFSAYTNGGKLFAINSNNPDQLQCLNGLRVISMMWVVLGHQYSTLPYGIFVNGLDVSEWMGALRSMYIFNATLAVDTFLFLSGFLMAYGFLKAMSKGLPFNIPLYWLHRYLRLTPALAAVILLQTNLAVYFTSGPFLPSINELLVDSCKNYWWSALLYLQNYINVETICIGQSWYLSVDMQLFILSPLILIPLWKWKRKGLANLCLIILISIAVSFTIAWVYSLSHLSASQGGDYMTLYYHLTHTRASPWLIGVLVGYAIFRTKQRKSPVTMNLAVVLILWVASLSVLITCVFGGHYTIRGVKYEKWPQVSHVTFVKPAWAIALGWLVFACVTGYGGPINWFLSFPAFQVLGRLTYSVYLLHATILFAYVINMSRLPRYFSDFDMMYTVWGTTMFSAALAVVWNLAFESPMIVIEKVLFHNTGKPKPKPEINTEEEHQEKC